jgi:hypothetical protein
MNESPHDGVLDLLMGVNRLLVEAEKVRGLRDRLIADVLEKESQVVMEQKAALADAEADE